MKKYYGTLLLSSMITTSIFMLQSNVNAATPPEKLQIHGHRGARALRPENTLAAFQYALDNHVDVLEMDMQVTKDNVIVISHEPILSPEICLNPDGSKITKDIYYHDLTLAQVKTYDCGTIHNAKFPKQVPSPKEKVPTLEEVFKMAENSKDPWGKKIQFNIETKIYPNHPETCPSPEAFVKLFYELVKKHHMVSRVILQSFDDRSLIVMKKLDPRVRTAMLTSDNHIDYVAVAKAIHADIISPDWEWILPNDVQRLHKIHVQVAPWTPDDPAAWKKLIDMNVDAIITDDPKALQDMVGRHP